MTEVVRDADRLALGVAELDAAQARFLEQAAALARASDTDFPALFDALVEDTRRRFDREGELMRASAYPTWEEHEYEHRRILEEMGHLTRRVAAGRIAMAQAYVEGLPIWFANHRAIVDAALAAWLKARP